MPTLIKRSRRFGTFAYVHVCMRARVYMHACEWMGRALLGVVGCECVRVCGCVHVCVHPCVHACMCAFAHACVCVQAGLRACVCRQACVRVCAGRPACGLAGVQAVGEHA